MPAIVVVGMQWGDEAKGKIVDVLSRHMDVCVRYNGGPNAGHKVVFDGQTHVHHVIPAGIHNPGTLCLVCDGLVIDPKELSVEIDGLRKRGVRLDNLHISQSAHVIMPWHKMVERAEETKLAEGKIGTTLRGIGPCYADKARRWSAVRMGDLVNLDVLRTKVPPILQHYNAMLACVYGAEPLELDAVLAECETYAKELAPYIGDTQALLQDAVDAGKRTVFEGSQGTMLDLDQGTFPFVSSSHPIAGGACLGTGVGPRDINEVIGVVKAYTSRVGEGPFPTELHGDAASNLREKGREYGSTTGRPRRVGWLDAPCLSFAARVNSVSAITLQSVDVLSDFPTVKICRAYRINGREYTRLPSDRSLLNQAEPVFEEFEGWTGDITGAKSMADLPASLHSYVATVEKVVSAPVAIVSVGPGRDQTILTDAGKKLLPFLSV
jgi:adenylosuccinate synthase